MFPHLRGQRQAAARCPITPSPEARRRAAEAVDQLRGKFGMKAVTLGTLAEGGRKPREDEGADGPEETPERDERG